MEAINMGMYKHIRELWKDADSLEQLWRKRLINWRKEPATLRINRPTRLDRARSLGYKAKQGVFVVRQRLLRGGHVRKNIIGGRRSKHARQTVVLDKNYQRIAEERAACKFVNCEVLNSYYVAQDGKNYWYEVILIDRAHPSVLADKNLARVAMQRGRAFRGLTSAGRRSRGLRWKGKGAEHLRPSKSRQWR